MGYPASVLAHRVPRYGVRSTATVPFLAGKVPRPLTTSGCAKNREIAVGGTSGPIWDENVLIRTPWHPWGPRGGAKEDKIEKFH